MYFIVYNYEFVVLVFSLISKLVVIRLISIIIVYKLKKAGWESWCKLKIEREYVYIGNGEYFFFLVELSEKINYIFVDLNVIYMYLIL